MTRIITGTVSVDPGGRIVTAWSNIDGVTLSEITAPAGSSVVIEGRSNFIKTRLSTTSFELMLPHAGDGGPGLDCAISALTAGETQIGTLNARTATVIQQLGVLDANGRGLFYNLIGATGDNDPGPGQMAFNNADPELVTELYLDVLDANEGGRDITGIMGLWTAGTVLIVRSLASTAYAAFQISTPPAAPAGYRRASVSFVGGDGTLAQEPVGVEWLMPGADKDVDEQVADLAGRAAFDGAPGGFRVLVENAGGGVAVRYTKLSATVAHWSPGGRYTGPIGATGPFTDISFGPTTTLPAGSAATATVEVIGPGAIRIDLGLPRGLDGTGTGDFVGPASSADGEVVLFNGPTGKLGKRGRVIQTSVTDATAGRLAIVGAFGLGGVASPITDAQQDGSPTGFYRYGDTTTNPPPGYSFGAIISTNAGFSASAIPKIALSDDGKIYTQHRNGLPWSKIWHEGDIVGLIDSGFNANGHYVKFADGTMRCRHQHIASSGSAWVSSIWTFPSLFISPPIVTATARALNGGFDRLPGGIASISQFTFHRATYVADNDPLYAEFYVIAEGRWE